MEDSSKIYKDIAARERASRKAAERLLEEKSSQLYKKTERVEKAKQDVESLNMHLKNIMASSPDGIITCSTRFKIMNINGTASRQLQKKNSDIRDHSIENFIPEISQKIIDNNKRSFEISEILVRSGDGTEFPADVRGSLSIRANEHYFVLFIRDISDRLREREEKRHMHLKFDEARRLEAIGALSAGIAHEINTPIQYIGDNLGFLLETMGKVHASYLNYEALSDSLKAHKNPEELIKIIDKYNSKIKLPVLLGDIDEAICEAREGIDQVRNIIMLMKEFAHPGQTESNEADINDTINGVVKITNSSHKGIAKIELDLCETLPYLNCRRNQIRQVILNMVLNAVDAIEETNNIPGKIRIETRSDDSNLYIIISDTGRGIPAPLVAKIFDPFFTTKPVGKGTGQGLALAKDFIVSGHRGDLSLVSVEGYQTSFEISLPLNQKTTPSLETSHAA